MQKNIIYLCLKTQDHSVARNSRRTTFLTSNRCQPGWSWKASCRKIPTWRPCRSWSGGRSSPQRSPRSVNPSATPNRFSALRLFSFLLPSFLEKYQNILPLIRAAKTARFPCFSRALGSLPINPDFQLYKLRLSSLETFGFHWRIFKKYFGLLYCKYILHHIWWLMVSRVSLVKSVIKHIGSLSF